MNEKTFSPEQHTAIIDAIRATFEEVKHHIAFGNGGRFATALRKRLPEPYGVHCNNEYLAHIYVWGHGVAYSKGVSLCFNANRNESGWQAALAMEIDRNDQRDYQERIEQEKECYLLFQAYDMEARLLRSRLARIRELCDAEIERLPEPASATVRKGACHWGSPSAHMRRLFPNVYSKEN